MWTTEQWSTRRWTITTSAFTGPGGFDVADLPPGAYTAVVARHNDAIGVALVEVCHLP